MHAIALPGPADFSAWRDAARRLLGAGVPPEGASWRVAGAASSLFEQGLFDSAMPEGPGSATTPRVPRNFLDLAEIAIRHSDPERFALLYALLWRITHGTPVLMQMATDPAVLRAGAMSKAVRRDAHKMHAFLRFRQVETEAGPHHVAWFEPDHHIEAAEAGFFVRRFAALRWTVMTPRLTVTWDGKGLAFGPPGRRAEMPPEDATAALWDAYYAATFNPARLKPDAMRAEMPKKYWHNLPETAAIPRLIAEAQGRVAAMVARGATPPNLRPQKPYTAGRAANAAPRGAPPIVSSNSA